MCVDGAKRRACFAKASQDEIDKTMSVLEMLKLRKSGPGDTPSLATQLVPAPVPTPRVCTSTLSMEVATQDAGDGLPSTFASLRQLFQSFDAQELSVDKSLLT